MLKGKFIGVAETTSVFVVEKRFVVKREESKRTAVCAGTVDP